MNPLKKFFGLGIIIIILLFLLGFFADGFLFLLASGDDKLYGDENRYIDPTLTGDALTNNNNLKDSYKFQNETSSWWLKLFGFFKIFLKILLVVSMPLLIYYLFIKKDASILEFYQKYFGKY